MNNMEIKNIFNNKENDENEECDAQEIDTNYDLVRNDNYLECEHDNDDEIKDDENDFDISKYISKYLPNPKDYKD